MKLLDEILNLRILNNIWITQNYNELRKICKSVTKSDDIDEIFQVCIEQFLINKKTEQLEHDHKFYFFSRIVKNQYYSKTSKYYTIVKNNTTEFKDIDIKDTQYEEPEIDLKWVNEELHKLKQTNDWYYGRLMELYIEEGCSISKLSRKTTIPINSVSRDINKVRKLLRKKRDNKTKQ